VSGRSRLRLASSLREHRERLLANPLAGPLERALPPEAALAFHRSLPNYAPTPLVDAQTAAEALGVARVLVKDESSRLGLPSFKILGASWAVHRALQERGGRPRIACATDGNHGRAVARVARQQGLEVTVFVPANMIAARRDAIAREGARVEVVDGSYDEAVEGAAATGALVIQDTGWPGYEHVPGWIVEGYGTIGAEIDHEPDVVAVQIGVGSFAAAMVRRFAGARIIGVEPVDAACALASAAAGELVEVPGPHDSVMAGLNCGRASITAWPVVSRGIEAFAAVSDDRAREAVRLLARDGVTAGESGAAGLAGLLAFRDELALSRTDTVLVINTEGDTSA
jgi:diaminopropionate ammonia-lyase